MDFEERVAWVIRKIKEKERLNNSQIGKLLGVTKNTIAAYSEGRGDLKGVALAGIVKHYGINGEWLIAGTGEPFPGAREKYPEACGPPSIDTKPIIAGMKAALGKNEHPTALDAQQINVNEAMGMTYHVLTSGTPFAVALYLNIQQFSNAVNMSHEIRDLKEELRTLNGKVDILQKQVDRLTAAPVTATAQEDSSEKAAM